MNMRTNLESESNSRTNESAEKRCESTHVDMPNMSNIELHQVDVSQTMVKKTWDKTEQIVLLDYCLEVFSQDFRLQACPHIRLHRVTFFTLDSRALYLCHLCHPQKN